jgi:hypothetical protein
MTRSNRETLRVAAVLLLSGASVAACAARESSRSQAPRTATWVVFVDDLHLDFRNTGRIRDLLRRIGTEVIHDGDTFSVAASGPSKAAVPFTTDRARFAGAVKMVAGNGLRPSDFTTDIGTADAFAEVRYRARVSLLAAQQAVKELASHQAVGGRTGSKALIYLSNGYFIDASADEPASQTAATRRRSIPTIRVKELRARMSSFSDVARRARIKVFTIDVRSAIPGVDLDSEAPWPPRYWAATQQSLRALTARTGGLALVGPTSVAPPTLAQISQTMRGGF